MDNNRANCDQPIHPSTKVSHADFQADVTTAKLAWDAWKSNEPDRVDWALQEKHKILKEDPKAWKEAMKEVDADQKKEADAKKQAQTETDLQKELAAESAGNQTQGNALNQEYLAATAPPPAVPSDAPAAPQSNVGVDTVVAPTVADARPGYSPNSPFAPPEPNNPAYDQAYHQPVAKFYGLNLGIVKLGVTNHGSIDAGVNIGIARAEAQVGLENRVEGEFMPVGGPIHARVGAGVGINRDGLHAEAGAGGNFFNIANVDGDGAAHIGRTIGVDGDVRGRALIVNGEGAAGASLGPQGVEGHGGGNADLVQAIGARGGGRVALGENTGVAAGVGLNAGGNTLDFGPSIDVRSDVQGQPAVIPSLHLDPGTSDNSTFFPTGNRAIDQSN
jgi:hypothetical protein